MLCQQSRVAPCGCDLRLLDFPLIRSKLSVGVSIYGNGGMNTAYTANIPLFSAGPATFRAGVDLQQLFISPTIAFKVNAHNAVGVSLNIGCQKFAAQDWKTLKVFRKLRPT
jgi:long-subunit fatty acid transport protein